MKTFYQCSNCGFISTNGKYCLACADDHQIKLGDFERIEEAMISAHERAGGFYGSLPKQGGTKC